MYMKSAKKITMQKTKGWGQDKKAQYTEERKKKKKKYTPR
jgi:hypothetical protein